MLEIIGQKHALDLKLEVWVMVILLELYKFVNPLFLGVWNFRNILFLHKHNCESYTVLVWAVTTKYQRLGSL